LRFKYTSKQVPHLFVSTQTYGEGKVKVISSKRKEDFHSESRPKSLFQIEYTLNISTTPQFLPFVIFALRLADDMKLVENSEVEELAARLVFPENMELIKNV